MTDTADVDLRLVPAALTAWAVTAAGILWSPTVTVAVIVVATGSVATVTALLARRGSDTAAARWPAMAAVALVGACFAVSIGMRAAEVADHPVRTRTGDTVEVTVRAVESPRVVAGGRVMFRGALLAVDDRPQSGRVLVFASVSGFGELTTGRPAHFRASIGAPTRRDLTVATLSATGAPRLGEAGPANRLAARVRSDFAEAARAALSVDQAAMLPALVLGDTSAVDRRTVDDFRTAGLTHLTAVSGANVTIVCGAVLLSAMLVGPRIAVVLAALALVAFVFVVQPTASVLRAAIMGAITLLAVLSHRRRQAIPALAATVLTVMIGWPEMAVDVGFALSASATAALVVIAPRWAAVLEARGWPAPLAGAVSVAVAAHLVTAPLVAGIAGTFSVVAVLANLAVTVVVAPITILGTLAATLATPWSTGAAMLIRFTGPELWWLLRVAEYAASVPGAAIPVPSGVAGVLCVTIGTLTAIVAWRRPWGRVLVVWCLVGLVAWAAGGHVTGA
ncbi:ComEC/Rec2 family competence protein [Mycolicibacterium sediminis]|uniref:Competence protein n=1 Tax=Mycolicibacterium sediminis TaxID=1286180 RepID=A0A7I7QWQ7_9MYCO|nr:ComEC/Rec2 family competence protein [Mycolicibacterium sediminis]BBY30764.1 competence protein [Mycolicibacterium sediminis]